MRVSRMGLLAAVAVAVWIATPSLAWAQPNNASITARANVLRPVTVANQQDLDFGNVFPGVNKSVAITDASAGRWFVTGATSAEVDLDFGTLPTDLSDGSNNLPIAFGAGSAGYNTTNAPGSATTFDPAAGATTNLSADPVGQLYTWIAGTVQPSVSQPAGLYTGTITLTVTYTGN